MGYTSAARLGKFVINSQSYSKQELIERANQIAEGEYEIWEKKIWACILEWFDESDQISFFTSGTTGPPKEIFHSKKSVESSAKLTQDYFHLSEGSEVLLCIPANFVAGKMMVLRSLICNWNLVYIKPSAHITIPEQMILDFTAMVPMQLQGMIDSEKDSLSQIRKVLVGGAPLSQKHLTFIADHSSEFFESYGSTETLTHVALKEIGLHKSFMAIGQVSFGVDDRDCLTIHAPHISNNPIQTNDIVKLISPNSFELLGRYDDVINSGGVKIHPAAIEQKLSGLIPYDYFIGKKNDELLGEKVVLYIEKPELVSFDKPLLDRELEAKLNKFERPKEIIWVDKIEKTFSGKIKRI